ncbi:hypothetical protein Tsubulata_017097 [Turnera subulata]|uniref:Reverse transcriptase zinc-binding domain-containing protein n=1 Tax=Turnera subulata TaxID=218843 RepID=A0A9Q0FJ64_9ROSI|nr:hypothetical protein Tsubulata_017097 [Turnera subulata]
METSQHLFLHCKKVWKLWQNICKWWGVEWVMPESVGSWFTSWQDASGNKLSGTSWMLIGITTLWSVWLARNELVFNGKAIAWDSLFDLILARTSWWIQALHSKFPYNCSQVVASAETLKQWRVM